MNWTDGYITDLNYTHGYYREMSPAMLDIACLCAGVESNLGDQINYLELGFGQGHSINIHAAATKGCFWGNDFNPAQTVHALESAAASGADIHLLDDSFEELATRTDLPVFDMIVLHGIWSWVSETHRETIVDIIRRRLRPGGIIYVSYNCLPGTVPVLPIRQLLTLHQEYGGRAMAGTRNAVDGAVQFSREFLDADSMYFKENPSSGRHLQWVLKQDHRYIAHEFLNADWHPLHFSDMARVLADAKLSFVGPARLLDRVDANYLSDAGRKFLASLGHPALRETVRDYLINQRFRCDVFIKGPRIMSEAAQCQAWQEKQFVLTTCHEDIPKKIAGSLGEMQLPTKIDPVIEALSERRYVPKRLQDLMQHPKLKAMELKEVIELLMVLMGAGFVSPAQSPTAELEPRCRSLNTHLSQRALLSPEMLYLASPVTGGGVFVSQGSQLFISALNHGKMTPDELAIFVWNFLDSAGERLIMDGQRVESKEENIRHFTLMAKKFLRDTHPLLAALKII